MLLDTVDTIYQNKEEILHIADETKSAIRTAAMSSELHNELANKLYEIIDYLREGNKNMMLEHVRYQEQEWIVLNEFMSGNGTHDIMMLEIENILTGEKQTVAEIDVDYITPF